MSPITFLRTAALAAALFVVATTVGAGSSGAAPTVTGGPVDYVALGDSYSSAASVAPAAADSPRDCYRSSNNFSGRLAREFGYRLTDVSCAGATTADFFASQHPGVKPQLDALSSRTDLVTFTIGGNDGMIFADTVRKCVTAAMATLGQGAPCRATYGDSIGREIRTVTYPKLVRAMGAVRVKAPNARVAVLSYPLLLPDRYRPCPQFPIAAGDFPYAHGVQAELNAAIRRAAGETGVIYVDVTTPSVGHDSCRPVGVRWVEPVVGATQLVPVHPNGLGEREMAAITAAVLHLR
ncbi:SGNH/GDSL hydrolase family protein [Gordonia sp. ABSL1-1]|uniref:SGNH/GDSL hydrolase family protein n=1 Tax=Gordonia sp. ABSL1-1 TaxID=3053923 RepID=UPI0025742291|nr:SGNH/GDSL hydrolase family protein [Gordonia sp. ABSL1-1]MDL9938335.1 SGNH/GDSL hydrolase family protein [Gordonia sp. ABSL1-1]